MLLLYVVQNKIETHLNVNPEHKGKQQEQTCPSQCPLYNPWGVVQRYSIPLKYREQQQAALTVLLNRGGRSTEKRAPRWARLFKREENPRNRSVTAAENILLYRPHWEWWAFHKTYADGIQPKSQTNLFVTRKMWFHLNWQEKYCLTFTLLKGFYRLSAFN